VTNLVDAKSDATTITSHAYSYDAVGNRAPTVDPDGGTTIRQGGTGAIGTTRALTDADQDVTDSYILRAFGTYRATTGSTVNNFRYIGKLGYYRETALSGFYLRRRYYAPEVGRFVSRDPIRTARTNRYRYVGNRATRFVDPGGLQPVPSPITPVPIICDLRPRLCEPWFPPLRPKVTLPPGEPGLPWCPPRRARPIAPGAGAPIRPPRPHGPVRTWPGPLPGGRDFPLPQPPVNPNEPVWAPIEWTPAQQRWWRLVNALIAQTRCQGFYDLLLHGGAAVSVEEDAIQSCCWDILGELGALGKAGGAAMEACEDALYELLGRGRPR
jgi:RHS repeat-associated protein